MDEKERARALDLALSQIEKQFWQGHRFCGWGRRRDRTGLGDFDGFDFAGLGLGVGGVPRGRICEIFGPNRRQDHHRAAESSPKRKKKGGIAAFIDVEHALDPLCEEARRGCGQPAGYRSRTGASRRWRSRRTWSAPGRSTSWWWIRCGTGGQIRARGRDGRQPHGRAERG